MLDVLNVISKMSVIDKRNFKLFLEKSNKRKNVKNIEYFDLLQKEDYIEKEIKEQLYPDGNYGAYHGLRKRFIDALILFITEHAEVNEVSSDMEISKLIMASRNQLGQKHFELGFLLLNRAEKKSVNNSNYILLNQIYHLKIQYAHRASYIDLEKLLPLFKANQNSMIQEEKFNMAYALVNKKYGEMLYEGQIESVETLIEDVFKSCEIEKAEGLSYKSIYQLSSIFTKYAKLSKNFYAVKSFVIDQFTFADQLDNVFNEDALYKMEVIYLIANMHFRVKEFDKSLEYTQRLEHLCRITPKYKRLFYKRIVCLKALALHFSNNKEVALGLLTEELKKVKLLDADDLNMILSAIMMFIQIGQFKEAQNQLGQLKHSDQWYTRKMGKDWVLQKHFMEIILNIELGNIDKVDSRLRSFVRNYSDYFNKTGQQRVLIFIQLIKQIYHHPEYVTSSEFHEKVERSFDWKLPEQEDIFVMSCFAWLKSKMFKTELYTTTLGLVAKKSNS